ncbi:hypothetical protein DM02DRAFT_688314 [Periconia macrospinosa]|uniref:Uncharacterized protein n=1 Tax=Periconia macrospinosa TaxID=97972 RepID=A0A2V1DE06_9PLEO|nr:hypothetical protein DM02DRAFT_688314 [Periconia macrospinosa]
MHRVLKIEIGSSLAVLRITQGALSTVLTFGLSKTFELLHWGLTGRRRGLRSDVFFCLSPTTPGFEVIRIVISRASGWTARLWGLVRVLSMAAVWIAAVLLFVRTSVVTAYDSVTEYNVTAGVGQFNGSLVPRAIERFRNTTPDYPYQILPFSTISSIYSLVGNSVYSTNAPPIDCEGCDSYLLTGGVIMTTSWMPAGFDAYPLVSVGKLPATQIQFRRTIPESESFQNEDCDVFGREGFLIGIRMCVARSKVVPDSVIAGVYVCTNGTENGECERVAERPNITTTMSVYDRTVSLVASRMNYSILAVTEYGLAHPSPAIDIHSFRQGLAWFLDFNASATPPPSSFAEPFWSGQEQLKDPSSSSELMRLLQSILAFPFWYFQPNNYGNPDLEVKDMTWSLPKEFYTTARITRPYMRITIDRGMLAAFIVLNSSVLIFIWGVLLWLWISRLPLPVLSSYPLIDFAFKNKELDHSGDGFGSLDSLMMTANNKDIRHRFGCTRVTLRGDKIFDSGR